MSPLIQYKVPTSATLLAALIVFQSVGWLLALQGLQLGVRIESKRVLFQPANTRQETTLHRVLFQKQKIGQQEIRLNGQLFDYRIVSETIDSLQLTLYHDVEEENLLTLLEQKINTEATSKDSPAPEGTAWVALWFGSAFLLPENLGFPPGCEPVFPKHNFTPFAFIAQSAPRVFAPPPEAGV